MENGNGTALKVLTSFFGGVILSGALAFFAYPKDLPTKADMERSLAQTSEEISETQKQLNLQQDEITSLRINLAKIAEKLRIDATP